MVSENSVPNATYIVMAVAIPTLLCTGITSMFTTAYEFGFGAWSVFFVSLIFSSGFAALYYQNKKWLTALALAGTPAVIATAVFLNIFNTREGLAGLYYNIQEYAFYFLPDLFDSISVGDGHSIEAFLNAYNIIAISFTTHALIRRKNIPWTLLLYAPVFVIAVENTTMLPKTVSCIVAATGILLLILAHAMRNKEIKVTGKMLLILSLPVLLFSIIISVIFPASKYDKNELASDFLSKAQEMAENISG